MYYRYTTSRLVHQPILATNKNHFNFRIYTFGGLHTRELGPFGPVTVSMSGVWEYSEKGTQVLNYFIAPLHFSNRIFNYCAQCRYVYIRQLVYINTGTARNLVLTKFFKKQTIALESWHDINSEIGFARRETCEWPVTLLRRAFGFVVV